MFEYVWPQVHSNLGLIAVAGFLSDSLSILESVVIALSAGVLCPSVSSDSGRGLHTIHVNTYQTQHTIMGKDGGTYIIYNLCSLGDMYGFYSLQVKYQNEAVAMTGIFHHTSYDVSNQWYKHKEFLLQESIGIQQHHVSHSQNYWWKESSAHCTRPTIPDTCKVTGVFISKQYRWLVEMKCIYELETLVAVLMQSLALLWKTLLIHFKNSI